MKETRVSSWSFLFSKKCGYIDYENIKKVTIFNYKEFENSLLEMNNRELDVSDLMVPVGYMRPKIVGNHTILYKITRNNAVDLIKGNPSKEIMKQKGESGYTEQTVIGLSVKGKTILAIVAELYQDVLTDEDTIAPSDFSCNRVVESQPQKCNTNRYLIVNHYIVLYAKKDIVGYFLQLKNKGSI